ncbi:hypothetical protein NL676_038475 [Syzygium grande]|nr:hypothetical protein NL676_038475 [Syzygium grande]
MWTTFCCVSYQKKKLFPLFLHPLTPPAPLLLEWLYNRAPSSIASSSFEKISPKTLGDDRTPNGHRSSSSPDLQLPHGVKSGDAPVPLPPLTASPSPPSPMPPPAPATPSPSSASSPNPLSNEQIRQATAVNFKNHLRARWASTPTTHDAAVHAHTAPAASSAPIPDAKKSKSRPSLSPSCYSRRPVSRPPMVRFHRGSQS